MNLMLFLLGIFVSASFKFQNTFDNVEKGSSVLLSWDSFLPKDVEHFELYLDIPQPDHTGESITIAKRIESADRSYKWIVDHNLPNNLPVSVRLVIIDQDGVKRRTNSQLFGLKDSNSFN
eukprot:GHVP01001092.1.p1 GENE.GHVP01001092.1~~GHVP01001092.1.p1  ORF type:complete len:120 (-),score=17.92 GHVP01001092.1:609-968(-)